MTTGLSIFLIAAGATLRYALSYRLPGVDLHALGLIIMAAGAATLTVCLARAIPTGRRRRPAPVPRTLPLPDTFPPELGTSGYRGLVGDSTGAATAFRDATDGTFPRHVPHPGIPRAWSGLDYPGHRSHPPGYPDGAGHGDTADHWPEADRSWWPDQEDDDLGRDDETHHPLLPPRSTWQLDETGWPDESTPRTTGRIT